MPYSKPAVTAVFQYLRDFYSDDPVPQFSLKIILAGPTLAGKTSVLRRLRDEESDLADKDTERTIGLDVEQ